MGALATAASSEKTTTAALNTRSMNAVYPRTFTYNLPTGVTAGTATLGIVIPANTAIIGGWHKATSDLGGTATLAYSVTGGQIFAAATILNQTAGVWKALTLTQSTLVNVPAQDTDGAIIVTLAAAAAPTVSGGTTVTVTLLLCPVGESTSYTTFIA